MTTTRRGEGVDTVAGQGAALPWVQGGGTPTRRGRVTISQRMARHVSAHLKGGKALDDPDLWQALGGTLADYFGESSARTFTKSEEISMDQFFGTLKKLVEVSLSSQRVALKSGGGSSAVARLKVFREEISKMEEDVG